MIHIKAPQKIPESNNLKIFLAGSIEMGTAEEWQEYVADKLQPEEVLLLNPRRDDWDSTWLQVKENPEFKKQVEWELDSLAKSDYIILYFDRETKSPISLLEMGLFAQSGKLLVVCPEGFWRKGNVDIVCEKYGFLQFETIDNLLDYVIPLIKNYNQHFLTK